MMKRRINQIFGFTLIELVITIALAGIVMMMITPYFQSGITTSHLPAQRLQDAVALQRVMENINGAYGATLKDTTALGNLKTNIGAAGSSFNNQYGVYRVLENGYISFTNGAEVTSATATPVLKVTIRSTTNPGYQLTQLFTVQVSH